MHVSLPRRSPRVGLSMQYLLWICFGLLAVVPWQVIRGQETPAKSPVGPQAGSPANSPAGPQAADWSQKESQSAVAERTDSKRKRRQPQKPASEVLSQPSPKSLIFRAQTTPPPPDALATGPQAIPPQTDDSFMADDRLTGKSGQAYGIQSRASVYTGPGIGRQHPILPIEMMPYAFFDNNLIFADIRGFTDLANGYGMNLGGGYRRYLPRFDRILGVNGFFDYDNTSGALFRELGFGAESLGALFDVRANAYLPTGNTSQQLSLTNVDGTQIFGGHLLKVDQARLLANALHGFDAEIVVPLPGPFAQRHDIRVAGGGYWFEGTDISSFGGWKTRIQGNVIPSVQVQLQVSNDMQFNTLVVFGATWTFGGYKQPDGERKTQYSRMTTPVLRQYNMVVGLTTVVDKAVTVIDPATGNPYFFEHVASYATGLMDGTVEHPFQNVAQAQAVDSPNDIIFVHQNSVYNGVGIVLQDNVRVLGEAKGVKQQVNTVEGLLSIEPITGPNAPTGARPIFDNAPGTGVILANNSEFSGFQIGEIGKPTSGPGGIGISGDSLTGTTIVRQTDVSWSGGDGVLLNNIIGNVIFRGDTINDPAATGATTFHVTNTASTGQIIFSMDPVSELAINPITGLPAPTPGVINNVVGNGGSALIIDGTARGSVVNFTGSTVNDTHGNGIFVTNDAGLVALGDANVLNGLGVGISILNDSGVINGNGTYIINGSAGDSISIQNLAAGGLVLFTDPGSAGTGTAKNASGTNAPANIAISNRNARGIYLNDNGGNVSFQVPVSIQAVGNVNLAAIEYQGSKGNVIFSGADANNNSITITNGGPGILIGTAALDGGGNPIDNTGTFTVSRNTTITGTSATGIAIEVTADKSTVLFEGATAINNRGNIGIEVLDNNSPVTFSGNTTIQSNNGFAAASARPGVDIRGNTLTVNNGVITNSGSVTFGILNVNDAIGPAVAGFGGTGVNIGGVLAADANPANVKITSLNIVATGATAVTGGTALFVSNEGQTTGPTVTGLTVSNGTLVSNNGEAIDMQDSVIQTTFNSVSSSNSPTNGILLVDDQSFTPITSTISSPKLNDFMFQVIGVNQNGLSGGTITNAALDGVRINQTLAGLNQTGDVNLNQMTIQRTNGNGALGGAISALNILQLQVANADLINNIHNGITASNVPLVNIQTSNFSLNGTTVADDVIHLTANQTLSTVNRTLGIYNWTIANNGNNPNNPTSAVLPAGFLASTTGGDLVHIDSGGQTLKVQTAPNQFTATPLELTFFNNSMTFVNRGVAGAIIVPTPTVALNDQWTGFQFGSINQNTIILAGENTGIQIVNSDPTFLTTYEILGNTITGGFGGNIGINVDNFGPTNLTIASYQSPTTGLITPNTFNFVAPAAGGIININDVAIEIQLLNSTIPRVASDIIINDNIINLAAQTAQSGLGIFFPLLQAPATVQLNGNQIAITSPAPALPGEGIYFQNVLGPGALNFQGIINNNISINGVNTFPNGAGIVPADWVTLLPFNAARTGQFIVNGLTFQ